MSIGEIVKTLVKSDNYFEERVKISDEMIDFIKTMLHSDYELFQEKEEAYKEFIRFIQTESV